MISPSSPSVHTVQFLRLAGNVSFLRQTFEEGNQTIKRRWLPEWSHNIIKSSFFFTSSDFRWLQAIIEISRITRLDEGKTRSVLSLLATGMGSISEPMELFLCLAPAERSCCCVTDFAAATLIEAPQTAGWSLPGWSLRQCCSMLFLFQVRLGEQLQGHPKNWKPCDENTHAACRGKWVKLERVVF